MILNFTQWERVHTGIIRTREWFKENGLFKGYMPTLDKIAESTLHELSQVREYNDWDTFLKDIPVENRLSLELIVNFGNYKGSIDWPDNKRIEYLKELKDNMIEEKEWTKIWIVHHSLFLDRYTKTYLHYNPKDYGGFIWVCETACDKDGTDVREDTWGIMCGDKDYVPISVDF